MENHNPTRHETPADNLIGVAVSEAPNEGQLLAGKFKSKDVLLDSVSNLVSKVEGRTLKPSEVISLADKSDKDLEDMYLGLERQFHNGSIKNEATSPSSDEEQVDQYLAKYMQKHGFVRKADLEAEQVEKQQLQSYFSQNPTAKSRQALIMSLANTPDFQGKSFAEVDQFIVQSAGITSQPNVTKNVKLGQNSATTPSMGSDTNNWTAEDWDNYYSGQGVW